MDITSGIVSATTFKGIKINDAMWMRFLGQPLREGHGVRRTRTSFAKSSPSSSIHLPDFLRIDYSTAVAYLLMKDDKTEQDGKWVSFCKWINVCLLLLLLPS